MRNKSHQSHITQGTNRGTAILSRKIPANMILPVAKIATGFATLAANVVTPGQTPLASSTGLAPMLSTSAAAATISSPYLLQCIRGGASAAVDISREQLFVSGIGTYGTITALIMNASLRM